MKNWVKYAKFEEKHGYINSARRIFERAVDFFGEENMDEKLLIAFAKFEEAQKEVQKDGLSCQILKYPHLYYEKNELLGLNIFSGFQHDRTRVIYKYALDKMPKETCQEIYKAYTVHEKKYGDRAGIEDVIVSKRKFQYEEVYILPFSSDWGYNIVEIFDDNVQTILCLELWFKLVAPHFVRRVFLFLKRIVK